LGGIGLGLGSRIGLLPKRNVERARLDHVETSSDSQRRSGACMTAYSLS
jgi:hypothetical protein